MEDAPRMGNTCPPRGVTGRPTRIFTAPALAGHRDRIMILSPRRRWPFISSLSLICLARLKRYGGMDVNTFTLVIISRISPALISRKTRVHSTGRGVPAVRDGMSICGLWRFFKVRRVWVMTGWCSRDSPARKRFEGVDSHRLSEIRTHPAAFLPNRLADEAGLVLKPQFAVAGGVHGGVV